MSYVVLGVIEALMDTNDEVRRRRLERLCKDEKCSLVEIAGKAGLSWASLDQIQKRVLLPAKDDGSRSARSLGDIAARKIEAAYELPAGWLDWPFEAVDYASYVALSDIDKGAAQARMMAAIESTLQTGASGNFDGAEKHQGTAANVKNVPVQTQSDTMKFGPALTAAFSFGRDVSTNGESVKAAAAPKKRRGSNS